MSFPANGLAYDPENENFRKNSGWVFHDLTIRVNEPLIITFIWPLLTPRWTLVESWIESCLRKHFLTFLAVLHAFSQSIPAFPVKWINAISSTGVQHIRNAMINPITNIASRRISAWWFALKEHRFLQRRLIKCGASSWWLFGPNSAWGRRPSGRRTLLYFVSTS